MYAGDSEYQHCRRLEWNQFGDSLGLDDFEFPMMALRNKTEVQFLIDKVTPAPAPSGGEVVTWCFWARAALASRVACLRHNAVLILIVSLPCTPVKPLLLSSLY